MKVEKGDIVKLTHYAIVEDPEGDFGVEVKDLERGVEFNIVGDPLVESLGSADFFDKSVCVSRSDIVEIFENAGDEVFTVEFIKANGEERGLRGRMVERETGFGRSQVVDLDIAGPNKLRQVDHRTIYSLVLNGVKYSIR